MAKNNKKNQPLDLVKAETFNMNPNTKGAIFTIIVFLIAFLSVLSLFNLAGPFGQGLSYGLGFYLAGQIGYLFYYYC